VTSKSPRSKRQYDGAAGPIFGAAAAASPDHEAPLARPVAVPRNPPGARVAIAWRRSPSPPPPVSATAMARSKAHPRRSGNPQRSQRIAACRSRRGCSARPPAAIGRGGRTCRRPARRFADPCRAAPGGGRPPKCDASGDAMRNIVGPEEVRRYSPVGGEMGPVGDCSPDFARIRAVPAAEHRAARPTRQPLQSFRLTAIIIG
jgi:hypothetical protein